MKRYDSNAESVALAHSLLYSNQDAKKGLGSQIKMAKNRAERPLGALFPLRPASYYARLIPHQKFCGKHIDPKTVMSKFCSIYMIAAPKSKPRGSATGRPIKTINAEKRKNRAETWIRQCLGCETPKAESTKLEYNDYSEYE